MYLWSRLYFVRFMDPLEPLDFRTSILLFYSVLWVFVAFVLIVFRIVKYSVSVCPWGDWEVELCECPSTSCCGGYCVPEAAGRGEHALSALEGRNSKLRQTFSLGSSNLAFIASRTHSTIGGSCDQSLAWQNNAREFCMKNASISLKPNISCNCFHHIVLKKFHGAP